MLRVPSVRRHTLHDEAQVEKPSTCAWVTTVGVAEVGEHPGRTVHFLRFDGRVDAFYAQFPRCGS